MGVKIRKKRTDGEAGKGNLSVPGLWECGFEFGEVVLKKSAAFMAEYSLKMVHEYFVKHCKRSKFLVCKHVIFN